MTSRALALFALVVVIAASSAARLAHLGDSDLWFDEFLHVLAARSMVEGKPPVLPSGARYDRNLEYTRLVAIAQRHVADPELAARLPSALFGIANVIIFAAIAWRIGGPWVAVWAALLLGTYPGAVLEARNSRFYTEQLDLGLIAFWFGWLSVRRPAAMETARWEAWAPIAGCLLALGAAFAVQVTTGSVAAGWAVALATAAALDVRSLGRAALRRSARVQAVVAGVIVLAVVLVARPTAVATAMRLALYVPPWAVGQYSPKAYYWMLSEWVPLLLALLPAIFLIVFRVNGRLAMYLGAWFAVPLVLHSFILRFQAPRYVLVAMPGLLLAAAVAAASACGAGFAALRAVMRRHGVPASVSAPISGLAVLVCAAFVTITTPAFTFTTKNATGQRARTASDWNEARAVLGRIPGSDSIPWGTGNALASLFYWGRADFSVYRGSADSAWVPDSLRSTADSVVVYRDAYTGTPALLDPAAIRRRYAAKGAVLVTVDSAYYAEEWETPVMRALRREAIELCERQCGPMRVFYWRFADSLRAAPPIGPMDEHLESQRDSVSPRAHRTRSTSSAGPASPAPNKIVMCCSASRSRGQVKRVVASAMPSHSKRECSAPSLTSASSRTNAANTTAICTTPIVWR